MISHLRGRLLEKHPNRVIVDVNGVGYDVHVPLSTFYEMAEPGAEIALRIHTHVREDALVLYGFATVLELQIFERLISVSGIGPKLALAVLSGIEPNELVSAIRTANVARLTGIPGIGKKTAERIGLELKDKMASFLPAEVAASPAAATSETLRTDVLSALMNLGYHRPLAERAVDAALKNGTGPASKASSSTPCGNWRSRTRVLHRVWQHERARISCIDSGHSRHRCGVRAHACGSRTQRRPQPTKFAELWQASGRPRRSRDLFHGPGGAELKPAAGVHVHLDFD